MAANLPDELWRRILELGIKKNDKKSLSLTLTYKDLCCLSISCRRLYRLSNEDPLWFLLFSLDFSPQTYPSSSSSSSSSSFSGSGSGSGSSLSNNNNKSTYQLRFEKDRARKLAAHRRALLRMESQVGEHSRKIRLLELQLDKETLNMNSTIAQLSNLRSVRQSSVALNVWQPEIIRSRQKQIVEQCVVPVESRITSLDMELRLCKNQISALHKAYENEKKRLETAKEQLVCMNYHPLRDYKLENTTSVDESKIKKKKNKSKKRTIDCIDIERQG